MPGHRAEPQLLEAGSSTPDALTVRAGGRRRANVPVDYVSPLDAPESSYVGRRRAAVLLEERPPADVVPEPVRAPVREPVHELARELDTVTIERVLNSLEPVDHTTSFEHEPTTRLPMLRAEPPTTGGKRRAVKHAGGRGPLFKGFLSAPVLMGIAALAVSVGGVITVNDAQPTAGSSDGDVTHSASALGGTSGTGKVSARKNGRDPRPRPRRPADAAGEEQLQAAADAAAKVRAGALTKLAAKAEVQAKFIAKNLWVYPLELGLPDRPLRPVRPLVELPHRPRLQRQHRRRDPLDRQRRGHLRQLRRLLRQQDRGPPRGRHRDLVLPPDLVPGLGRRHGHAPAR